MHVLSHSLDGLGGMPGQTSALAAGPSVGVLAAMTDYIPNT